MSGTLIANPKPSIPFKSSMLLTFDAQLLKDVNAIFNAGTTFKHLSNIHGLTIAESVINFCGADLAGDIKVAPPVILVEASSSVSETTVISGYGELAVFTPAQFWNNVTKMIEYERRLPRQEASILGEETHGIVFLVDKGRKDQKANLKSLDLSPKVRFAMNLYREFWKGMTKYYLTRFEPNGAWEEGHYFAIKASS